MTYMLRDRFDGQFEIVMTKTMLVGVFPDRQVAQQFCAFLATKEPELPEEEGRAVPPADEIEEQEAKLAYPVVPPIQRIDLRRKVQLPAVIAEPKTPTVRKSSPPQNLTPEQVEAAFKRLMDGEKIAAVAPAFGLSLGQLKGMWANSKRGIQKHMADGGQQPCSLCQTPFVPSVSHPDTCARCSRG